MQINNTGSEIQMRKELSDAMGGLVLHASTEDVAISRDEPVWRLAVAEAAPPQAAPSAPVTAQDIAPAVAPTSSELAQLFKEITRVLTNVEQGVEQLKAGQEQLANNNAKVVEQLRASQEQMTRLISNTSERNVAPKTSVPPPRPNASQTPKPVPTSPQARASPQARVQPRTPGQLAPQAQ